MTIISEGWNNANYSWQTDDGIKTTVAVLESRDISLTRRFPSGREIELNKGTYMNPAFTLFAAALSLYGTIYGRKPSLEELQATQKDRFFGQSDARGLEDAVREIEIVGLAQVQKDNTGTCQNVGYLTQWADYVMSIRDESLILCEDGDGITISDGNGQRSLHQLMELRAVDLLPTMRAIYANSTNHDEFDKVYNDLE
jgi:hypothetical protein